MGGGGGGERKVYADFGKFNDMNVQRLFPAIQTDCCTRRLVQQYFLRPTKSLFLSLLLLYMLKMFCMVVYVSIVLVMISVNIFVVWQGQTV